MSALDELEKVIGYWEENKKNPSTARLTISGDVLKQAVTEIKDLQTELADYKKHADVVACTYCGHEIPKSAGMIPVLEHIATCEKRPEKAIFKRAFEVNDMLIAWLEHVAGVGSPIEIKLLTGGIHTIEATPHYFSDCETCKQIAGYLEQYHGAGVQQ